MAALDGKSPIELLVIWTEMGRLANSVNRGPVAPAKGPRGVRRRNKRRRLNVKLMRERSSTLRSIAEAEKIGPLAVLARDKERARRRERRAWERATGRRKGARS